MRKMRTNRPLRPLPPTGGPAPGDRTHGGGTAGRRGRTRAGEKAASL